MNIISSSSTWLTVLVMRLYLIPPDILIFNCFICQLEWLDLFVRSLLRRSFSQAFSTFNCLFIGALSFLFLFRIIKYKYAIIYLYSPHYHNVSIFSDTLPYSLEHVMFLVFILWDIGKLLTFCPPPTCSINLSPSSSSEWPITILYQLNSFSLSKHVCLLSLFCLFHCSTTSIALVLVEILHLSQIWPITLSQLSHLYLCSFLPNVLTNTSKNFWLFNNRSLNFHIFFFQICLCLWILLALSLKSLCSFAYSLSGKDFIFTTMYPVF